MEWKAFATVFAAIFIAELGDKTQLATFLFASRDETSRWVIFAGAASALVLASAVSVLAGTIVSQLISEKVINYVAGAAFIAIGIWTISRA